MIADNIVINRNFQWIDVVEPHEEDLNRLSTEFGLPYLLVLDCLKPEHLPKYELTDDGCFLMLRSFDPSADKDAITVQDLTRKIALFITEGKIVTIHRVELQYLQKIEEKCLKNDFPKTLQGLVHQIILSVIRTYEEPLEQLQENYDGFEEDILERRAESLSTTQLYVFRRKLFMMKRMLKQTNDALYRFRDFWEEHPSMLQDMRENVEQIYFRLDEISDNFEHLFQLYISLNDQRANEVMKILTVFSSILLPLNFIASFYGMNFSHLPGLNSPHALYLLLLVMFLLSLTAIWYFRRRGWFKALRD
jgi:magnesium transporter